MHHRRKKASLQDSKNKIKALKKYGVYFRTFFKMSSYFVLRNRQTLLA